jgi:hypothetical protein
LVSSTVERATREMRLAELGRTDLDGEDVVSETTVVEREREREREALGGNEIISPKCWSFDSKKITKKISHVSIGMFFAVTCI